MLVLCGANSLCRRISLANVAYWLWLVDY